jgi:hypothetical protein
MDPSAAEVCRTRASGSGRFNDTVGFLRRSKVVSNRERGSNLRVDTRDIGSKAVANIYCGDLALSAARALDRASGLTFRALQLWDETADAVDRDGRASSARRDRSASGHLGP